VTWLCAVVAHNAVHAPVFHRRWMNSAFQIWVSLSCGFPISDYMPGHSINYLWRTFVSPGRRETFDGRSVAFPEIGSNLDWVVPERRGASKAA
jgi:hypothetical protein